MTRYSTVARFEVGVEVHADCAGDADRQVRQVVDDVAHLINESGWPAWVDRAEPEACKEPPPWHAT